jgi:hypothetical protein
MSLTFQRINGKPIRVYIAGPYTKPDPVTNTAEAIKLGDDLVDLGFIPYIPHLTHFWHLIRSRPYQDWLDIDNEWISACDVLYRMHGESKGADKEVALAKSLDIPVVDTFATLLDWASHMGAQ